MDPADRPGPRRPGVRLRTLLWLPILAAVPLTCARVPTGAWHGERALGLEFLAVDPDGRPIPGVTIQLVHPDHNRARPPSAATGADGRARIVARFRAGGTTYPFGKTTAVGFEPWVVEARAPGYRPYAAALGRAQPEPRRLPTTDPPLSLAHPAPTPIRLGLEPEVRQEGPGGA